jgi:hypothetical protein
MGLFARIWGRIVADTPPELAACEDCRWTECTQRDWERCRDRIQRQREAQRERARQAVEDAHRIVQAAMPGSRGHRLSWLKETRGKGGVPEMPAVRS